MIYFVDIDKTICEPWYDGAPYNKCEPKMENIAKINELFLAGHTIVYWTSRGSLSNAQADWFHITYNQLAKWGCKFHELRMGKPFYDAIIDDKALRIDELCRLI